jgi:hypothetical protein
LDRLIELVNLLPADARDTRNIASAIEGYLKLPAHQFEPLFEREFGVQVEGLPGEVKDFIGVLYGPLRQHDLNAMRRYNQLVESRFLLTIVASNNRSALEELRAHGMPLNEENLAEIWASRNLLDLVFSRPVTPLVMVNERGEFEWRPPPLFEAMQEKRAALRIRECPSCSRFFYAGRIDQVACGPPRPCANRLRYRRYYNANLRSERKRG